MPAIRRSNVAAGTANALNGLDFEYIGPKGALVSLWISTPTAGGTVSYSVGAEKYLVDAYANVESAADDVDVNTDQVLFREPVGPGRQYLSTATQIINFLLVIEEP